MSKIFVFWGDFAFIDLSEDTSMEKGKSTRRFSEVRLRISFIFKFVFSFM